MQDRVNIERAIAKPIRLDWRRHAFGGRDPELPKWLAMPTAPPFVLALGALVTGLVSLAVFRAVTPTAVACLVAFAVGCVGFVTALVYEGTMSYLLKTSTPTARYWLKEARGRIKWLEKDAKAYNRSRFDALEKIRLLAGVDVEEANRQRAAVLEEKEQLERCDADLIADFDKETALERACFTRKRKLGVARKLLRRHDLTEDQRHLLEARIQTDEPTAPVVTPLPVARLLKS